MPGSKKSPIVFNSLAMIGKLDFLMGLLFRVTAGFPQKEDKDIFSGEQNNAPCMTA